MHTAEINIKKGLQTLGFGTSSFMLKHKQVPQKRKPTINNGNRSCNI